MSRDKYDRALAEIYSKLNRPLHADFILQNNGSVTDFLFLNNLSRSVFESLDAQVIKWWQSCSTKKIPLSLSYCVQRSLITCLREYGKSKLGDIPISSLFSETSTLAYAPRRAHLPYRRLRKIILSE